MIGSIFYFLGLFVLLMSFSNAFNYLKYVSIKDWIDSFKKVTRKEPVRSDYRSPEDYNIFSIYATFAFVEFIWIIVGITSRSWYVFLSIILIEMIFKFLILRLKSILIKQILGQIYTILKFITILLLILNHFHFHYNWIELFRQFFNEF